MSDILTMIRPDDWHLHLRDNAVMKAVVGHSERRFGRAIVMPNLQPPIITTAQASAYRQRILAALRQGSDFTPLMTLFLTDNTSPDEITQAHRSGIVHGIKLYPAGATTHSDSGVTAIEHVEDTLWRMAEVGLPLLVHGEVTRSEVDIFDRERYFIDEILAPLHARLPKLRIVMEHITTADAVAFVRDADANVAATITPHHLLYNRNAIFTGGIRPHFYCLPVLKRESHREALIEAAISGDPKFFLGTDSAPHARHTKESSCGCAGIYSAHAAIELYAELFDSVGALDRLEGFASLYGADFYGLSRNSDTLTLVRESWEVPAEYAFGTETVVPLRAGENIAWHLT